MAKFKLGLCLKNIFSRKFKYRKRLEKKSDEEVLQEFFATSKELSDLNKSIDEVKDQIGHLTNYDLISYSMMTNSMTTDSIPPHISGHPLIVRHSNMLSAIQKTNDYMTAIQEVLTSRNYQITENGEILNKDGKTITLKPQALSSTPTEAEPQ